jgi:hypothetical protein
MTPAPVVRLVWPLRIGGMESLVTSRREVMQTAVMQYR